MNLHRETHLHRIGFLIGERGNLNVGRAGRNCFHTPVHSLLTIGGNLNRLHQTVVQRRADDRRQRVAAQIERHLHLLG